MNDPINICLVLIVVMIGSGYAALMQSPDALDVLSRKMRARARAMRASKKSWEAAYRQSIKADEDRDMMLILVEERQQIDSIAGPE